MGYRKLVRDKIPDIIEAKGLTPKTRKLRAAEYKKELLKKLSEEVAEVRAAKNKKALIEELADVQEVLTAIYEAHQIACGDVTTTARKKRKERGAFKDKIFLEGVKK